MVKRWLSTFIAVVLLVPTSAAAQDFLADLCENATIQGVGAERTCLAVSQAAASAQPALGLLVAGGSPTTGSVVGGFRLGVVPRVSAGVRLNAVRVRLPDIIDDRSGDTEEFVQRYGTIVPAVSGDLSAALTDGWELAPGVSGIGAISLLVSASYLPFDLFNDDFDQSDFAYGVGARVHLLNESFVLPAVALSLMRRSVSDTRFGDVCRGPLTDIVAEPSLNGASALCPTSGDVGEVEFDLVNWSTRGTITKHLFGVGASVGLGYDRYSSDLSLSFRAPQADSDDGPRVFIIRGEELESSRWAIFAGLSYGLVVANVSLEAGWQQGADIPIRGFRQIESEFDPGSGNWFGSLGVRVAL